MKFQRWNIRETDESAVRALMDAGYPYLISTVLAPRGVCTAQQADSVLRQDEALSLDPMDMMDMDKAVARLRRALEAGEKIAVFGDYDVDGITATCLVTDALRRAGGNCVYYIPHRIDDGYGLNSEALRKLKEDGVSLVVTVDCGITGVEEAAFAREIGLDLVITDHHECKDVLPGAEAVVNPHRSDCAYPFKNLAGVGVALKLVMALAGRERYEAMFTRYCTLAAIGTVADVMSMTGENRTIVHRGLEELPKADCVGLHALLREAGLEGKAVSSTNIGFVLAPRINAAGRMGQANMAAELFLTGDSARAALLARELCELNRERQRVEQTIFAEAEERIARLPEEERSALVLESDTWHQGVVGIVASRLSEKYACPSFMIHLNGGVGKGSCRSWGGFNLFAALESCADLLLGFGGHELAAGFTIEEKNIPAFRKRMNQIAREYRGGAEPISSLDVDVVLNHPSCVTLAEVEALDLLEPYGAGNNRPVFCLQGATLERMQNVGQNRHLKLRLSKGSVQLEGIFFSACAEACGVTLGSRVDAAFYLQVNEFRGNRSVQMQMVDIRPSLCCSGREEESLQLLGRCLVGEPLQPKEIMRLQPTREQCVRAWRALQYLVPPEGLTADYLPLVRQVAGAMTGAEGFLRAAFSIEIFRERELLRCERQGDQISLQRSDQGKKVSLEESIYLRRLAGGTEMGK